MKKWMANPTFPSSKENGVCSFFFFCGRFFWNSGCGFAFMNQQLRLSENSSTAAKFQRLSGVKSLVVLRSSILSTHDTHERPSYVAFGTPNDKENTTRWRVRLINGAYNDIPLGVFNENHFFGSPNDHYFEVMIYFINNSKDFCFNGRLDVQDIEII